MPCLRPSELGTLPPVPAANSQVCLAKNIRCSGAVQPMNPQRNFAVDWQRRRQTKLEASRQTEGCFVVAAARLKTNSPVKLFAHALAVAAASATGTAAYR